MNPLELNTVGTVWTQWTQSVSKIWVIFYESSRNPVGIVWRLPQWSSGHNQLLKIEL